MTRARGRSECGSRQLLLPGGEAHYFERPALGFDPDQLLQTLIAETAWRSESIVLWGRRIPQPRLIAWHGDEGRRYTYSGLQLEPTPWTPTLRALRDRISAICDASFDSVLLNYYRDHRDSMGMHSDDEPELGARPTIASVSLGEERVFVMKSRDHPATGPLRIRLASGSLLVMRGETQRRWKHGLPKQAKPCGPRVNLTFRSVAPMTSRRR